MNLTVERSIRIIINIEYLYPIYSTATPPIIGPMKALFIFEIEQSS